MKPESRYNRIVILPSKCSGALALTVLTVLCTTSVATELGISGIQFTLNSRPTFLLGASYYGALGASEEFIRRDLDDLQQHGFNWVRVWATWSAFTNDVSAVDSDGNARESFLEKLVWVVGECDRRGMVVDVTLSRGNGVSGPTRLRTLTAHRRAVETLVTTLKAHRNWYLDLGNERNIRDARFVSVDELRQLRETVKRLDPARLVTASHAGGDLERKDVRAYLLEAQLDFLAPHRPRDRGSAAQTERKTKEVLDWMEALGRRVPVHYQEPFRRGYGSFEPSADDFGTDLAGARKAGAAGWCFHNGDARGRPDGEPRRSFDLRHRRLFEQLDDEERRFVASLPKLARRPSGHAPVRELVACPILVPITEGQAVVEQAAPTGKKYPVFRLAEESSFVSRVGEQLQTSFAQQALRLNRLARNFASTPTNTSLDLREPMYLLLSQEDGGFPRHGFWLQSSNSTRELKLADYVDLVVDDDSLADGSFEEIFSHELGHLTLTTLMGDLNSGPSRKMHMVMNITDYPTAFNEGFAEHFQPLVYDLTKNELLRERREGHGPSDLRNLWFSRMDQYMRTDGLKRNAFIHEKEIRSAEADLYQAFLTEETSPNFSLVRLRTPQQMICAEGVIATIFYRIVNDDRLRNRFLDASFYSPFLNGTVADPESSFTPYENITLKLFAAFRAMAPVESERPPIIELIRTYGKLFPEERDAIVDVFVRVTWGATASLQTARALETAAEVGSRGDVDAYRTRIQEARKMLNQTVADVVSGKLQLDVAVGPEIWLLNDSFKISKAVWVPTRDESLTLNVNTATGSELATIPGMSSLAANIVDARRKLGFFPALAALSQVPGVTPELLKSLEQMARNMKSAGAYHRE